jgi:hypothetical protein
MREQQRVKQKCVKRRCFGQWQHTVDTWDINKDAYGESIIIYGGLSFDSELKTSTPPALISNSFAPGQSKNCVIVHELHKKEADNSLYLARINDLRSFGAGVNGLYI